MNRKFAIQGYEGSFHQEAAHLFYDRHIEVIPCNTFREVIMLASDSTHSDGGVMAIENSIAGSILPNYNLLQKSELSIIGELYLEVKQHLLVRKGIKMEDIREVHSHTMALQQCYDFLDTKKWKLVETDDTALSAKQLQQHKSRHIAAIAGKLAAKRYDLEILVPDIHTMKNNYTRFLFLKPADQLEKVEGANKASVSFYTDHSRGSLAKVLTKVAEGGINLSKLQSFPIPGSDFKYNFHADMEFETPDQFYEVIAHVKRLTKECRIYGVYKKGNWK